MSVYALVISKQKEDAEASNNKEQQTQQTT